MNPQFKDAFLQGFSSVFRQWTALELAVHNLWGGPQSTEKANELMNQVLNLFNDPKTIYKDVINILLVIYLFFSSLSYCFIFLFLFLFLKEISMLIEDYVDQEFSMICEDGSPEEIGEILIQMWRECSEGNFNLVQIVIGKERDRQALNPLNKSQGLEGGDVIGEDDDEEGGENPNLSMEMADIGEENEEEQEEKQQQQQQSIRAGPIIDEDGFETVVRGRKSRKCKK